ncbi:MAG: hypothetical protein Q4F84_09140, partial [Fibrobacter sp.]|nr:hypothetical protein [Fibrobacter sp.]
PEGMIGLVDAINLEGCNAHSSLSYYLKNGFAENSENIKSGYVTLDYGKIIDTYYVPALIDELFLAGSISKPPYDSLSVQFSVSPKGVVSNPKVVGKAISYSKFTDAFFNDLKTWVLPQYVTTETSKQIEHVFHFDR